MKKQLLILATALATAAFVSCNKEEVETGKLDNVEEIATAKGGNTSSVNLNKGLMGWYRFDGNLKKSAGILPDAVTGPVDGADVYMEDRKGAANSAIQFNGRYQIYINNVMHSPKMSFSAWVKYDDPSVITAFIVSTKDGPQFMQVFDEYYGFHAGPANIGSGIVDDHWHHLVGTIDGQFLKLYVDGNFIASIVSPDVAPDTLGYYVIGNGNGVPEYWHGAVDDVRIYDRTLSAAEVQALYNQ